MPCCAVQRQCSQRAEGSWGSHPADCVQPLEAQILADSPTARAEGSWPPSLYIGLLAAGKDERRMGSMGGTHLELP